MFLLAGACVDVIVDNDNVLQGIFFQDHEMRQCFSSYPELVCVDATYKLIELRFPLYIMLVEDGNGQSEIVAAFMVLQETESTISKMVDLFKKYNSSWERVRVIMTDKDVTERSVFSAQIPSARLVICLFHTLRSFRREVTLEKMGITSGQRNLCLEIMQQMAYAHDEDEYMELYHNFQVNAPCSVLNYFIEQWHSSRDQWSMGLKYTTGNFFNTTNNRLESINAKLKSVISRYSSLEEFVDKFFLIWRVLRCERDHKAALCSQKVPTTFHSAADAYSTK